MNRTTIVVATALTCTLLLSCTPSVREEVSGDVDSVPVAKEDDPSFSPGHGRPHGIFRLRAPTSRPSGDEESLARASRTRRTLFFNRRGGTYTAGDDDSSSNVSSVPSRTSSVGAYEKGDAAWQQFMTCIRDQFARFDVEVTDVDPAAAAHVECVVGGRPSDVQMGAGVGGVAPMNEDCSMVERAVVYVFSRVFSDPQTECEVAAQEVGHAIGMDHEYLCQDPMTYLSGCGDKTFQDRLVSCGEYSARRCQCGEKQNSVQFMLERLGPSSGEPPPPPPPPPPGDTTAPTVSVLEPVEGAVLPPNAQFTLVVQASDDVGVTRLELVWHYNNVTIACGDSVSGVTCTQDGDRYTWTFRVGSGDRTFEVRATDAAGNQTTTPPRTVHLQSSVATPVTPPSAPSSTDQLAVTVVSPSRGAAFRPGDVVSVIVRVEDPAVVRADLFWSGGKEPLLVPLTQLRDGRFAARIQVPQDAPSGLRTATITALDKNGSAGVSTVEVQVARAL